MERRNTTAELSEGFVKITMVLSYLLLVAVLGVRSVSPAAHSATRQALNNLDVFLSDAEAKSFLHQNHRIGKPNSSPLSQQLRKRDLDGWDEMFLKNKKKPGIKKPSKRGEHAVSKAHHGQKENTALGRKLLRLYAEQMSAYTIARKRLYLRGADFLSKASSRH